MFYGVAYYPEHWPEKNWANDARNMRECGMDGVRIGEFAWCKMEPEDGVFDFAWLDRAIATLGDAGLKVIIGTPTATPPSWLIHKHPEILPMDANGIQMKNGVRKYYCHSNEIYRRYSKRIAEQLAQRYGDNPHVVGWQIDNEFGDHDTVRCYCDSCRQKFITWCQEKFGTLDALNQAWGTIFWSQTYSAWEQIDLPYPRRAIGLNPGHLLDYYRFASDQVVEYSENQVEPLRKYIAGEQWITTNIIATYWEIDFKKLASTLDFISWDCYTVIDATSPVREPEVGPSPPVVFPPRAEMVSFVHDMMRNFSDQPFWVMETAGQDRLVSYHTLAHGGEGVNFFRWKGSRFGAEQSRGGYEYHGNFSARFHESKQISSVLHSISERLAKTTYQGQIGLLYSFDMGWAYDIQHVYPRSRWLDAVGYWRLMEEYYTAFWDKNIPVEPLGITDNFASYSVLIVPCLSLTNDDINEKLCEYVANGGVLIVGPASGAKDWNNLYLENLPPHGKLKELFGCELVGTGSLGFMSRALDVTLADDAPFAAGQTFSCQTKSSDAIGFFSSARPTELLKPTTAQPLGEFSSGGIACTLNNYGKGQAMYLGFSPDKTFMNALIEWLGIEKHVLSVLDTPEGVEATIRKGEQEELIFVVNHNFVPVNVSLPTTYTDIIHDRVLQGNVLIESQHTLVIKPIQQSQGGE